MHIFHCIITHKMFNIKQKAKLLSRTQLSSDKQGYSCDDRIK